MPYVVARRPLPLDHRTFAVGDVIQESDLDSIPPRYRQRRVKTLVDLGVLEPTYASVGDMPEMPIATVAVVEEEIVEKPRSDKPKLVHKGGPWYMVGDERFKGKKAAIEYLKSL